MMTAGEVTGAGTGWCGWGPLPGGTEDYGGAGHCRRDKAAQVRDTGAGTGAIRTIETTSAIVLFCFLLFT